MNERVNADQADFWNSDPGQRWVRFQEDLDALHEGVSGVLLAAARPQPGERVLDVGCGAGAQTFSLARAVGPEGRVTGVDFSEPLIARAEARQREIGVDNVEFRHGDASVQTFEPGSFDLVASRFGVMFFDDPVAAFRNIASTLRPGGRITFVAWQGPEVNPWFTLPLDLAEARLGSAAASPPDAPGPMAFRDADRVLNILTQAGLTDCRAEHVSTELHHPGGVAAATRLATQIGPISRLLREKGGTDDDRAAIAADLARAFEPYRSADGIRVPAGVIVFMASRT